MDAPRHRSADELEAGLAEILASPQDLGTLQMIVRRPDVNEREVLQVGELDPYEGLVGDRWQTGNDHNPPDPDTQITIMNARVIRLLAGDEEHWPAAGDQLFMDLDLRGENLPPGTRLAVGTALMEVTEVPHNGCAKFTERYGLEALKFVNSSRGKQLHLRGIYVKVVQAGKVRPGDSVVRQVGTT